MLDLIYMQVVASLLENEVDLSSKSSDELAKLITPIRSKPLSRKEIVMIASRVIAKYISTDTAYNSIIVIFCNLISYIVINAFSISFVSCRALLK